MRPPPPDVRLAIENAHEGFDRFVEHYRGADGQPVGLEGSPQIPLASEGEAGALEPNGSEEREPRGGPAARCATGPDALVLADFVALVDA